MEGEVTISLEEYERLTKKTKEFEDKINDVLDENLRLTHCLDDKYETVVTLNEWDHFQMSSVAYTNEEATKKLLETIEGLNKEKKNINEYLESKIKGMKTSLGYVKLKDVLKLTAFLLP